MMTANDREHVRRRARLQRWWPWAAALMLAAVISLWSSLFLSGSLLVNPWTLVARIEAGDLGQGTLAALAVLGSMAFLALGIVMLAFIAMLHAAMRNERRLLDIIRRFDI